jgi:hypothetical protein
MTPQQSEYVAWLIDRAPTLDVALDRIVETERGLRAVVQDPDGTDRAFIIVTDPTRCADGSWDATAGRDYDPAPGTSVVWQRAAQLPLAA